MYSFTLYNIYITAAFKLFTFIFIFMFNFSNFKAIYYDSFNLDKNKSEGHPDINFHDNPFIFGHLN